MLLVEKAENTNCSASGEADIHVLLTIAQIQLDIFGRFIKDDDKDALRREVERAKNASSPMERKDSAKKLNELTEKYGLFTHGFLLNLVGNNDPDPVRANKAQTVFNQFMEALNEGNIQSARDILSANEDLMEIKYNVVY